MPEVEIMWWRPHDGSGRMELVEFHGLTGDFGPDGEWASIRTATPGQPLFRAPRSELSEYVPLAEHDVGSVEDWLDA